MRMINPVGLATLIFREIYRYYKVLGQTLLAPVVTNALYLIVFSITLKNRMVFNGDISYLQFLVPGLIILGVINNSFMNSTSSLIIAKYNKTITDLLIVPLSPLDLTLAFLIASTTRGLLVGIVTYLTGMFFIDLSIKYFFFTILIIFLSAGTFAMLGAILGIKFNDYDQIATIQNFILTPLTFLGGVFYSIDNLPQPFNKIALLNPITYMINSLRYGFWGRCDNEINVTFAVLVMLCVFLLLFFFTYRMFKSGDGLRPGQ